MAGRVSKGGPATSRPVWVVFPKAAQRRARGALKALKALPPSRRFGTPVGISMARAMAAGKAVDARKVSHFFPRWREKILARERLGLTPMEDKIVGASDLWGGLFGDAFATREVERADRDTKKRPRRAIYAE
jgi:hypothetical protein